MAPQSLPQRALLLVLLVAGALVVGFFAWRAIDAGRDVLGESLVVEGGPDVQGVLALNATRTQTEAPLFAKLLDEAWIGGKATTRDPETIAQALRYLDTVAAEHGAASWKAPPLEGTFSWDDKTLRILHFER